MKEIKIKPRKKKPSEDKAIKEEDNESMLEEEEELPVEFIEEW